MYKIPLCIIAAAGLSSPLLAQSDGDKEADTSCEARSQDCDDGDRAAESGKAQVRGWNPERSAAGDPDYNDPDDDADGIPDAASLRGGGNDPLKGTNAQTCLVRPKACKGNPKSSGNGADDPNATARGGPKQTGKELKGIPAREGEPDTLPQDSDGDGFGDAASQSAGDPIPDIDITLDQDTTPSDPK